MPTSQTQTVAVSASRAKVWRALAAAKVWRGIPALACAAKVSQRTTRDVLEGLHHAGLVEKIRLGVPCFYRLAGPASAEVKAFDAQVRFACEVLGIGPGRKCREAS